MEQSIPRDVAQPRRQRQELWILSRQSGWWEPLHNKERRLLERIVTTIQTSNTCNLKGDDATVDVCGMCRKRIPFVGVWRKRQTLFVSARLPRERGHARRVKPTLWGKATPVWHCHMPQGIFPTRLISMHNKGKTCKHMRGLRCCLSFWDGKFEDQNRETGKYRSHAFSFLFSSST